MSVGERSLLAWIAAVLGVGATAAVAWALNGTPGARSVWPAAFVAIGGFAGVVKLLDTEPGAAVAGRLPDCRGAPGAGGVGGGVAGTDERGLAYLVDPAATFAGYCSHHVYGPWWEYAEERSGIGACPVGFTFVADGATPPPRFPPG